MSLSRKIMQSSKFSTGRCAALPDTGVRGALCLATRACPRRNLLVCHSHNNLTWDKQECREERVWRHGAVERRDFDTWGVGLGSRDMVNSRKTCVLSTDRPKLHPTFLP
ncbi:hypothetical protein HETIRDRAFT_387827, partial [Heterobasidion irregulare TC 32-1]